MIWTLPTENNYRFFGMSVRQQDKAKERRSGRAETRAGNDDKTGEIRCYVIACVGKAIRGLQFVLVNQQNILTEAFAKTEK